MGSIPSVQLAKADPDFMTSAVLESGGKLNPQQFDYYIELIKDQPTMLRDITIQPMNSHTLNLDNLDFMGRVTKKAVEGIAFTDAQMAKLTADQNQLIARKMRAEFPITGEMRKMNLMRDGVDDYAMGRLLVQNALDQQDLMVLGDTNSADELLMLYNGLIKKATTHVIDLSSTPVQVTDDAFYESFLTLNKKYRQDKANLRFYCSSNIQAGFNKWISSRQTIRGDIQLIDGTQYTYYDGMMVYPVSSMPDDTMILTNKKNIVLGILQDIETYKWMYPRGDITYYGLYIWSDVGFIEEPGVVVYKGLNAFGNISS